MSKFHKTTNECWQRTSGTQKSSPLSSKGGRGKNIKDKKRDKRGRDGAPSQEGSLKKDRSFQKSLKTLTAKSVVSLGTIEGNITRKKSKQIIKTHRFTCPTVTPSREAAQMSASTTSKRGLGREARAALRRVRRGLNAPRAI